MRLLAATSGSAAQGRLTEAGERVGEITTGGTIGFLVFVGLGGGLVTAVAYLVVRRWLPRTAGAAGPVVGLILVGSLGVLDPLSPDNVDFAILRPTWLAIAAVVATGLLFASTYTAVAARLDHLIVGPRRRCRWLPCAALPLALIPPFALFSIVYVAGRLTAAGHVEERADTTTADADGTRDDRRIRGRHPRHRRDRRNSDRGQLNRIAPPGRRTRSPGAGASMPIVDRVSATTNAWRISAHAWVLHVSELAHEQQCVVIDADLGHLVVVEVHHVDEGHRDRSIGRREASRTVRRWCPGRHLPC